MLGEVFGGEKKVGLGLPVAILLRMGQIAEGFREFYSQVGPKLAARIKREREGAFLEYMGDRVEESLFWRPVTPKEVEELCGALVPHKGMGWDGVSPRVVKGVAREISGPLSRLLNCCIRGGFYPGAFKVARVVPVFKGGIPRSSPTIGPCRCCLSCLRCLRGC